MEVEIPYRRQSTSTHHARAHCTPRKYRNKKPGLKGSEYAAEMAHPTFPIVKTTARADHGTRGFRICNLRYNYYCECRMSSSIRLCARGLYSKVHDRGQCNRWLCRPIRRGKEVARRAAVKVFISHSWMDKDIAQQAGDAVATAGEVWLDVRKLSAGD